MKGMLDSTIDGMSSEMRARRKSMMRASGEGMKGMPPMHRQMVANMIAEELTALMPAHMARVTRLEMHQKMMRSMGGK